jgi:hypothetical protein
MLAAAVAIPAAVHAHGLSTATTAAPAAAPAAGPADHDSAAATVAAVRADASPPSSITPSA